jgi:hypothetical protein
MKRSLKEMSYVIEGNELVIRVDVSDILENPESVLQYKPSATGNSYTIAQLGNNYAGERIEGQPISVKCTIYAGKKDIQDIQNLIATKKAAEEAAARQRELEELRQLKEMLAGVDINDLKKALATSK